MPVGRRRLLRRLRVLPWLAIALMAFQVHAVPLQGLHDGLDAVERKRVDAAVAAVMQRLPPVLAQSLAGGVSVHWVDDLPDHIVGRAFAGQLRLSRGLLAEDTALARQQLQATLIHELVHVADRSVGHWSAAPRLRELAGWQQRPWRLGRGANAFTQRQPDAYETHDAAEYLAVNMEHWLLDPAYVCRRPALAAWLNATFGALPASASPLQACDPRLPFVAAGEQIGAWQLLQLDPQRVYAVDYLFAEGATQPMSRWGHSMLRLVICRPGRTPGPACRLDLDQHVVLSFRAFVGDVQLSNWRGLTGGYPSRLFVLPLQQVIDEYTQVELRGLASYPLHLQPTQIASLLERAAQLHWSYDGRYRFVSNNCAVETAKLLVAGVPALDAAGIGRITPKGVRRRLMKAGVLDATVLADRGRAEQEGYYFASADRRYAMLFAAAKAELPLPAADARAWLRLPATTRTPWLQRGNLRTTAGLLLLEQAAQRRAELGARDRLKRLLLAAPESPSTQSLQALLTESGQWLQPAAWLGDDGYGLPQGEELQALAQPLQSAARDGPEQWQALRQAMRAQLPELQQRELASIEDNLDRLSRHLRARAPAAGHDQAAGAGTPAAETTPAR